jgi:hypothetical protein
VVLIVRLVAEADVVLRFAAMSTNVENGGELLAFLDDFWQIEIPSDIQPWPRLELNLLDDELFFLDAAHHFRLEIGLLRQGAEAEHLHQLSVQFAAFGLPGFERFEFRESTAAELGRFLLEVLGDHGIAARGIWLGRFFGKTLAHE